MARPLNPESTITVQCETCGNTFTCKRWKPRRFCSKKCSCNSPETKKKNAAGVKATFDIKYGGHPMATNPETQVRFKATMMATYGVDHPAKAADFREKVEMTLENRYGNPTYNNREKMRETCISRYGVDNYRKTTEYTEKVKRSSMKKWGVLHPSQSAVFKDSHKRLMFQKFVSSDRFKNFTPAFSFDEYDGVTDIFNRKYAFKCNRCGRTDLHDIADGKDIRCSKCDKRTISRFQEGVLNFVQSILPNESILVNDRTVLFPQELDIYIPGKNIAIETDGLFYHSEVMGHKNKNYHLHKTTACMMKGIRLIHIFENEWTQTSEIVQSILQTLLGVDGVVIAARKLEVRKILSPRDKSAFLESNHLQGNDHATVSYGLYDVDKLIALMSFVRSRFDKTLEWEMSRFCTLRGHRVQGGAAKLFSHFIKTHNPQSIVSYSDRRYFSGAMYLKLGMVFAANTPQSYYYILDRYDTLQNRMTWQKSKLKNKLLTFDPNLTEWQNMQVNGFDRIWDCGNLKFVWKSEPTTLTHTTTMHQ